MHNTQHHPSCNTQRQWSCIWLQIKAVEMFFFFSFNFCLIVADLIVNFKLNIKLLFFPTYGIELNYNFKHKTCVTKENCDILFLSLMLLQSKLTKIKKKKRNGIKTKLCGTLLTN